tara:strand:+ start:14918 stop:15349 length:432 start_codon:yes stop_codon:yes gene_type:complete
MQPPFMGRPDIVRMKGDGDYASKLSQSQQLQDNAFIFGMQQALVQGSGAAVSASRHPQYANTNRTTGETIGGMNGNFAQQSFPGNNPGFDFNQTGYTISGQSATTAPQVDPRQLGQDAAMRVQMIAAGKQYPGYNNRQQTFQA